MLDRDPQVKAALDECILRIGVQETAKRFLPHFGSGLGHLGDYRKQEVLEKLKEWADA